MALLDPRQDLSAVLAIQCMLAFAGAMENPAHAYATRLDRLLSRLVDDLADATKGVGDRDDSGAI